MRLPRFAVLLGTVLLFVSIVGFLIGTWTVRGAILENHSICLLDDPGQTCVRGCAQLFETQRMHREIAILSTLGLGASVSLLGLGVLPFAPPDAPRHRLWVLLATVCGLLAGAAFAAAQVLVLASANCSGPVITTEIDGRTYDTCRGAIFPIPMEAVELAFGAGALVGTSFWSATRSRRRWWPAGE